MNTLKGNMVNIVEQQPLQTIYTGVQGDLSARPEFVQNMQPNISGYPYNPPFPIPYTESQAQEMNRMWLSQQIKNDAEMVMRDHEYNRKERLKILSEELEEKKIERREELHRARELLTYDIFEDSEGHLCKMLVDSDGTNVGMKRICSARFLRMTNYVSTYKGKAEIICIRWDEGKKETGIFLKNSENAAKKMGAELVKNGIVLQTNRDYRKNLLDLVYAYLKIRANYVEIPKTFGWNLVGGKWVWADENCVTMEVLRKYV